MLNVFCLGAALTIGQGSPFPPPAPAMGNSAFASERSAQLATPQPVLPMPTPAIPTLAPPNPLPNSALPGSRIILSPTSNLSGLPSLLQPVQTPMPMPSSPGTTTPKTEPKQGPTVGDAKSATLVMPQPEAKPDDKGYFMNVLDGSSLGSALDSGGIKISGWADMSYTASTRNVSNRPLGWNDRADTALLQQFWVNIEKPIDWSSPEIQQGFKVGLLYGSDYRYTLIRGLFNSQLKNGNLDAKEANGFEQNIYGGDIPEFYYSLFLPGICGEGTEFRIGRMFSLFGYESNAAVLNPLMSHSYAFISTPFFNTGVQAITKINSNVTVTNMLTNGDDVFFDGSQKWRYQGQLKLTSDDQSQWLALTTSFGEGKFDASQPNGPAQKITTIGLAYEPFGRNNGNYFNLVYSNKLTEDFSVALEALYAYQQNVPAAATSSPTTFGGGTGTAHWESVAGYAKYDFSEMCSGIIRAEVFRDAQGTQTGFDGTYYSGTLGLQIKPFSSIMIRPEVRYDYNNDSTPFNGHHGLFTAGADVIFKF
jgi:hypothetical protein